MIIPGNLWDIVNETTFAVDKQEDLERENRIWGNGAWMVSSPRHGAESDLQLTVLRIQQVQMECQANQVEELLDRFHAKEMENIALRTGKRKPEEDE